MTVTVNVLANTPLAAASRGLPIPIHICISGSDTSVARAVAEFNRAAAG